jgi:hypothetical protein
MDSKNRILKPGYPKSDSKNRIQKPELKTGFKNTDLKTDSKNRIQKPVFPKPDLKKVSKTRI